MNPEEIIKRIKDLAVSASCNDCPLYNKDNGEYCCAMGYISTWIEEMEMYKK